MPIIAPVVGAVLGAAVRSAAGPLLARGASAIAGRAVSTSQLARVGTMAARGVRAGATASRMAAFTGNAASGAASAMPSVDMKTTPLPVLKAPTMGGEYVG